VVVKRGWQGARKAWRLENDRDSGDMQSNNINLMILKVLAVLFEFPLDSIRKEGKWIAFDGRRSYNTLSTAVCSEV
jgi:hypothetical protein